MQNEKQHADIKRASMCYDCHVIKVATSTAAAVKHGARNPITAIYCRRSQVYKSDDCIKCLVSAVITRYK